MRLGEPRVVGGRALQLTRHGRYAPARSTVTVCEWPDGRIAIEYRGLVQAWTEITGRPAPAAARPASTPTPPQPHRPPSANHPWRQSYKSWAGKDRDSAAPLSSVKGTFLSS